MGLVYREPGPHNPLWWVMAITAMTAGTVFLMWLGEQIDKYGIGNGVSLIITAGILAQHAQRVLLGDPNNSPVRDIGWVRSALDITSQGDSQLSWMSLILPDRRRSFFVVAGAVLMTVAQRRDARCSRPSTPAGGASTAGSGPTCPLRVNHGGVMPIIFASSIMMFPSVIFAEPRGDDASNMPDLVLAATTQLPGRQHADGRCSPTSCSTS